MRVALIAVLALGLTACEPEFESGEPAAAPPAAAEPVALSSPDAPKPVLGGIDLSAPVNLVGTEPFWNVKLDGQTMTYASPEEPGKAYPVSAFAVNASSASLSGSVAGGSLSVTLTAKTCSDGMSDRVYPLTAEIKLDGKTLNGCAISAEEMAKTKP